MRTVFDMPAQLLLGGLLITFRLLGQIDPWPGLFQSEEMQVTIQAAGVGYSGSIVLDGESYPLTARADGNRLTGTFQARGRVFRFTAELDGNALRLVSDGQEYNLYRRARGGSFFGGGSRAEGSTLGGAEPRRSQDTPVVSRPAPVATAATARMHRSSLGLAAGIPAGWTASDSEGGILMLPPGVNYNPARQDNPEIYMLLSQDGYTPGEEATYARQLSQAFLQGGARLKRAGERETIAAGRRQWIRYSWEFNNPSDGRDYALDAWITSEGSRAFLLMAVGHLARVRSREAELRTIAASTSFSAPRVTAGGPLADNTPEAQWWLNKLRGKVVRQFFSAGGGSGGSMTSETFRYLNADGTYSLRRESATSIYVPGASAGGTSRDSAQGRWRIKDAGGQCYLFIQLSNGETQMLRLTRDERYWYLDGEKAFAVDPE
jgi:hypothetical protein